MGLLSDVEALSFDCYGTLIDWEAGLAAVLMPWARQHDLRLTAERLLVVYGDCEAQVEQESPAALYPDVLAASMRAVGRRLGAAVSADQARALGESVPAWPAFADSAAALRTLSARYKLIILSNVDRASFAASNTRLGVCFDAVITAQDVGSYKPAPENFAALLDRAADLGVGEKRLLHVAQSLFHDHVPAQRAGLATVWIDRRHGRDGGGATPPPPEQVRPDWTFASMADFAAACDAAWPAP
jgi:2-haloalkanoic acid dehalogenase type II